MTKGVVLIPNSTSLPLGEKSQARPAPASALPGSEYFVPKPTAVLQGYEEVKGLVLCAVRIADLAGLKATPLTVPVGVVAGSAYRVPKPLLQW